MTIICHREPTVTEPAQAQPTVVIAVVREIVPGTTLTDSSSSVPRRSNI